MQVNFNSTGRRRSWDVAANESLLSALRRHGIFGVKHGCETGECGACTVLIDGVPMTSCTLLAAQAGGHAVGTVEAMGEHPEQGWKQTGGLHALQIAFIEAGAIQCGYCTPAQLLAAQALLAKQTPPRPKTRCARRCRECSVAAPVTSNRWKPCCARPHACAAKRCRHLPERLPPGRRSAWRSGPMAGPPPASRRTGPHADGRRAAAAGRGA